MVETTPRHKEDTQYTRNVITLCVIIGSVVTCIGVLLSKAPASDQ
jgi:hypothetical protein